MLEALQRRERLITNIFFVGAIGFVIVYFTQLPSIIFDESALLRIAYFFSTEGTLRSDFIPAQVYGAYWLPPVHAWFLAFWFKAAGAGILSARAFSLLCGALAILFHRNIARRFALRPELILIFVLLLVTDPSVLRAMKVARPDIVAVLFIALAIIFLLEYYQSGAAKDLLIVGALAATSLFVHPLAVFIYLALFIELIVRRTSLAGLLLFLTPLFIASTCYLIWIIPNWDAAYPQILRNMYFRRGSTAFEPIRNFLITYSHAPIHGIIHLGVAIYAPIAFIQRRRNISLPALISSSTLIFLFLYSSADSLVYVAPFSFLFIAQIAEEKIWRARSRKVFFSAGILLIFLSVFFYHSRIILYPTKSDSPSSYQTFCEEIAANLPQGSNALVYGYPDAAAGLWQFRPDLSLTTFYWFSDSEAVTELRKTNFLIYTIGTKRADDKRNFEEFWSSVSRRIELAGLYPRLIATVGDEKRDWEFSARIYYLETRSPDFSPR